MTLDGRVQVDWPDVVVKIILGLLALAVGSRYVLKQSRSVTQKNNTVINGDIVGGDKIARKD